MVRKSKGDATTNCANQAFRDGHDQTFGKKLETNPMLKGDPSNLRFDPPQNILDRIDRLVVCSAGTSVLLTDPKGIYLGYAEMMEFRAVVKAWMTHDCQARPDDPPRYNGLEVYEVKAEHHLAVA